MVLKKLIMSLGFCSNGHLVFLLMNFRLSFVVLMCQRLWARTTSRNSNISAQSAGVVVHCTCVFH
jgi:hypothetical protein